MKTYTNIDGCSKHNPVSIIERTILAGSSIFSTGHIAGCNMITNDIINHLEANGWEITKRADILKIEGLVKTTHLDSMEHGETDLVSNGDISYMNTEIDITDSVQDDVINHISVQIGEDVKGGWFMYEDGGHCMLSTCEDINGFLVNNPKEFEELGGQLYACVSDFMFSINDEPITLEQVKKLFPDFQY